MTTTTATRPRGRKPGSVQKLGEGLCDAVAVNDEDQKNDAHELSDFRCFLADDGVIDLGEAAHLSRHLRLDQELTRIAGVLVADAALSLDGVERLVDEYRART